jgi:integrase
LRAKTKDKDTMTAPPNKQKINALTVARLKPADKTYVVWDTVQRGLALRVRPTGARAWKAIYNRHGRTRWLHLGDANAIGLADARQLAAETMLAVARGGDPAADKKAQRSQGTFEELAARYVAEYAMKRNKSWKQADRLVRMELIPVWGKLQVAAITRTDVKSLMARITKPVLANQAIAAASAIFSWAVREELLKVNPCTSVERNETKSRERVLTDSEIPQFWALFDDAGIAGAALKVILLSGQRPGEVAHMRREHIADGWWTMPGAPVPALGWPGTKNGAGHRVWLPAAVQELIGDGASGAVFSGVSDLDRTMRQIIGELPRATPHDLRRTHGTTVTSLGFGRENMDRIMNHKPKDSVTDIYDRHDYSAEIRRVMEAVAAHIVGLASGRPVEDNVVQAQFGNKK